MSYFSSLKNSIFTLVLLAIISQSCTTTNTTVKDDKFEVTDSLISNLLIDTVQSPNNRMDLNFSAKITANDDLQASIYPMVSGIVGAVNVKIGDKVNKGQLLATVSSAEMAGFDKEVISAEAELKIAERALKQTEELYNSGLSSAKELEEVRNDLVIKKAELQRAKTTLRLNGGNAKGNYNLISPIAGFIIEKNVNSYMQLRPDNEDALFKVADLSNVWAVINIYESEFAMLKEGDEVEVSVLSYPEKPYKGKIERIYNTIDNESRVINARVSISNKDLSLKPGMMATVKVAAKSDINLPSINPKAVIFDENKNYVLVLDPKEKIRVQEIEIGRKTSNRTYVSKGLNAGDKVVASKQVFLFESLK
ncbi:MAG: efflux RND transporter periplasmic adaptor subunit [Pedobacter sp.]|uniref:efflux RND transporter periplasmic adaptor subunit n=1 Tax=Pedobacter sp. TaxID=1411316 RepID=UPI002806824F|nr:efflux RND transporter periplasmic adaptor subunit [Pedobacter sp.]MDQ8006207.1 efflux RND transporter periplasmic adaptor subunit [Pedobacter sp.]